MSGKNLKMLAGYCPLTNNKIPAKLASAYKTATLDPMTRYNVSSFGFADALFADWSANTRRT
eukprot:7103014-Prymnesium_polylepis.1